MYKNFIVKTQNLKSKKSSEWKMDKYLEYSDFKCMI